MLHEDFEYEIRNDGTVEITEYWGKEKELVVPGEIDGHPVTTIGWASFAVGSELDLLYEGLSEEMADAAGQGAYRTVVTKVELPDSVTEIADEAFVGCAFQQFVIPESVTCIGSNAFWGCENLAKIRIPEGVLEIKDRTFAWCTALTKAELPDGVTKIGHYAFHGCTSLTAVELPEGMTEIGENAFKYCAALKEIEIPDSVNCIGNRAFRPDVTLVVKPGSYAEGYAKQKGYPYKLKKS